MRWPLRLFTPLLLALYGLYPRMQWWLWMADTLMDATMWLDLQLDRFRDQRM